MCLSSVFLNVSLLPAFIMLLRSLFHVLTTSFPNQFLPISVLSLNFSSLYSLSHLLIPLHHLYTSVATLLSVHLSREWIKTFSGFLQKRGFWYCEFFFKREGSDIVNHLHHFPLYFAKTLDPSHNRVTRTAQHNVDVTNYCQIQFKNSFWEMVLTFLSMNPSMLLNIFLAIKHCSVGLRLLLTITRTVSLFHVDDS